MSAGWNNIDVRYILLAWKEMIWYIILRKMQRQLRMQFRNCLCYCEGSGMQIMLAAAFK